MEINNKNNPFYYVYLVGFLAILALPALITPFLFFPPDWGKTIVFRSILSVIIFLLSWQILFKKFSINLKPAKNKVVLFMLIFLAANFLATIFSQDINFSLWGGPRRAGGLINLSFFVGFSVLAFLLIKKEQWQKVWNFILGIGIVVSLVGIVQQLGLIPIFETQEARMPSTMGNTILLAIYLTMLSFIALSFLIKEQKNNKKWFYIFSLAIFAWVIFATGSRAAWLGLALGLLYFVLFFPKDKRFFGIKVGYIKIITLSVFILLVIGIFVINSIPGALHKSEDNKVLRAIVPRLSFELFLKDPRFSAWQISFNSFLERPLLGWGPENSAIGFDKHYDPSLPYMDLYWGGWYDRAHNFALEISATSGIIGFLSYLALIVLVFWRLYKLRSDKENDDEWPKILAHGIMATLVSYLSANFFSFDSFSTYLIFFILIAFSISLTQRKIETEPSQVKNTKIIKWPAILVLFILAMFFIWSYNIVPLFQNRKINEALAIAQSDDCQQAVVLMDEAIEKDSILNHYARQKYISMMQHCLQKDLTENVFYSKKGIELLQQEEKVRSSYTRLWIWLGALQTQLIVKEPDIENKAALVKIADSYYKKALELSPKRQEIFIEWAKTYMSVQDFDKMKEKAIMCHDLNPNLFDCYWFWGLAEIFKGNLEEGNKLLEKAEEKRVWPLTIAAHYQLLGAYSQNENFEELAEVYETLTRIEPEKPQHLASLAFVLRELNEYEKAYEWSLKFLERMPEAREEVILFISTFPDSRFNRLPK